MVANCSCALAPKKKEQQKMSLGTFLADEKLGSWADEMEDMPVYSRPSGYGGSSNERRTYSSTTGTYGNNAGGYSVREELPLPDKPPYTVHLGNLSFDATVGDVNEFFVGCECINVRIIEDKMEMKPKGFGYAEFGSLEGLKSALTLNQTQFQGRNIRISVADPPKDRGDRPDVRELGDWSRKGPLPDLPGRGGERRPSDRGYQSSRFGEEGGERRAPREPESDGKVRDFGNWERKGPLSPLAQQERAPREGGRPRTNDGPRAEGFRDRKASPVAWGEGRSQGQGSGSQEGSRPPRREFQERPVAERAPTAADQDNQWRSKMRPDPPAAPAAKSPVLSREGSEAPASPALPSAPAGGRPRLNLAKRTVSEAPADSSSSSAAGDAKASPFGAARPIDTAAKEKEIEEKRQQAIKEKKDADEKAKQEREAAKAKETEDNEKKVETLQHEGEEATKEGETIETENANGEIVDDKAVKPKEIVRDAKPKPSDTGAWRRPSGPKPPRDDIPRGPKGRGDYAPRGPRHNDGGRNQRQNQNGGGQNANAPTQNPAATTETAVMEEDGWSTVSKPKKNNRGGNAGQRAIAS
ncbi:putative translation initiation factor 4b protein [Botrytis cinerea BcDW1]|uniref:Putative translation initiation factor 4b protein n=1 Tax=Botryotinia fuckeliana (strain BcDW1) TaxID=1290391 RepID=M7UAD5_BOTF1|nr:putative translation initiation factor 4b protein [Botrytis cinerea BcDW1]